MTTLFTTISVAVFGALVCFLTYAMYLVFIRGGLSSANVLLWQITASRKPIKAFLKPTILFHLFIHWLKTCIDLGPSLEKDHPSISVSNSSGKWIGWRNWVVFNEDGTIYKKGKNYGK